MPTLNWIGKASVVKHHQEVPLRLLEPMPEHSCGCPADNGNLIVRGDNLHALKALLPRYAGQVRCIYIDPPYNTGEERGLERVEAEYPLGLADPTCPVTFIITQKALAEGWDCPFAYCLVSMASLHSATAVEQILGQRSRVRSDPPMPLPPSCKRPRSVARQRSRSFRPLRNSVNTSRSRGWLCADADRSKVNSGLIRVKRLTAIALVPRSRFAVIGDSAGFREMFRATRRTVGRARATVGCRVPVAPPRPLGHRSRRRSREDRIA